MKSSSNPEAPYQDFLKFFLLSALCLLTFVGLFNFLVDPFEIFNMKRIERFNKLKPYRIENDRLFKSNEIIYLKPDVIILGSSRIQTGIDTADVTQLIEGNVYNAALSGAGFEEHYAYFEHALYNQPQLKTVIIGLDSFAFNKVITPVVDYDPARLKLSYPYFKDCFLGLFTIKAAQMSWRTFRDNFKKTAFHHNAERGFYKHPGTVDQNLIDLVRGSIAACIKNHYSNFEISPKAIELFTKMVRTCREKNIDLKLFFCPYHANFADGMHRVEAWEKVEDLKRMLCKIHPIWDFSGYNSVTTKDVDLENNAESFYFDLSHFKPIVGQMVLHKMYGREINYSDFGILLQEETIEQSLKQLRAKREEWLLKRDSSAAQG